MGAYKWVEFLVRPDVWVTQSIVGARRLRQLDDKRSFMSALSQEARSPPGRAIQAPRTRFSYVLYVVGYLFYRELNIPVLRCSCTFVFILEALLNLIK